MRCSVRARIDPELPTEGICRVPADLPPPEVVPYSRNDKQQRVSTLSSSSV